MSKGKRGFQRGNRCGINTRFSIENQPKKRGRKPSLYKRINLPGEELSKEDYTNLMRSLLECSTGQLKKIQEDCKKPDSKIPSWVNSLIAAIFSDIRRGRIDCLRWILDRSFGKPTQIVDKSSQVNLVQNNVQIFNLSALNSDELMIFHDLMLKMEGKQPNKVLVDPKQLDPG
jgi:hypothetical protein